MNTLITDENALSLLAWPKIEAFKLSKKNLRYQTIHQLREKLVDVSLNYGWDLTRVQFEAKYNVHISEKVPEWQRLAIVDYARKKGLLPLDAYEWLKNSPYFPLLSKDDCKKAIITALVMNK